MSEELKLDEPSTRLGRLVLTPGEIGGALADVESVVRGLRERIDHRVEHPKAISDRDAELLVALWRECKLARMRS